MNLGPLEVIVIFIVALLVFGPNKLPEMGRQVGKAVREFRKFQSSFNNEFRDFMDEPSPQQRPPQQLTRTDQAGQTGDAAPGATASTSTSTSTPAPSGPGPAAASGPAVPLRPAGGDEERGSGNGDGSAGPATQA